jgi:hypothetical protein
MMNQHCLKCGRQPTINAHIFPQSAVRAIRQRGPDTKTLAVTHDRAFTAKFQNGFFDPAILCKICDGKIGVADKWFVENIDTIHNVAEGCKPFGVVVTQLDPSLVIQFAVSVIYRASLSNLGQFSHVSLGPYTEIASEIAVEANQSELSAATVLINLLTSKKHDTKQFAFYPLRCSAGNGPYFVFTISGIQFLVKFGGRFNSVGMTDDLLSKLRIMIGKSVMLCCYPFSESAESKFIMDVKAKDNKS